jgi:hypothetical protein
MYFMSLLILMNFVAVITDTYIYTIVAGCGITVWDLTYKQHVLAINCHDTNFKAAARHVTNQGTTSCMFPLY